MRKHIVHIIYEANKARVATGSLSNLRCLKITVLYAGLNKNM